MSIQNKGDLILELEKVQSGLTRLGRQRKVVLSHHESFELLDDLEERVRGIHASLSGAAATQKPAKTGS